MAGEGSALHVVLSAVVAGLRARPGYRAPWATGDGTTVYDSVEVMLSDESERSLLVIGYPGTDGAGEVGEAGQTQATLSTAPTRTEVGSVRCLAVVQTGDHEIEPADVGPGLIPELRGEAFALLDDVAAFLRANPALGLMPTYPHLHAQIGGVPAFRPYVRDAAGAVAEVEFEIGYQARI